MELAIIGLEKAGKSTLFRALAAGHAPEEERRGQRLAAVPVPDERLERLAALLQPRKVTRPEALLHDLPPWPAGGRPPSPEAATAMARADAFLLVLRAFQRQDVPHPLGSVDPERDLQTVSLEMAYHDLAILERRLERLETTARTARPGERELAQREQRLLARAREALEAERPLREEGFSAEELKQLANYNLLTLRPLLVVVNLDEADAERSAEIAREFRARHAAPGVEFAALSARLEAELAELSPEEAATFRSALKATGDGPQRLLAQARELLRLVTFYTVVRDECRAWLLPEGGTALDAAAKIHSDMARGFVRAEVIPWDRLLELGSFAQARAQGALRSEGKGYPVQDGDVLHILFH